MLLTYFVRDEAPVELSVLDADDALIVSLPIEQGSQAGVHRTVWDMRYPPPTGVEGASFWDESGAAGPLAPPGTYQLRLTVGADTVLTQSFEILADPRVPVEQADLMEQFQLAMAIRDRLSETHATANRIASLRRQIATWRADPRSNRWPGDSTRWISSGRDRPRADRTGAWSQLRSPDSAQCQAGRAGSDGRLGRRRADAAGARGLCRLSAHLDRQLEQLRKLQAVDLATLKSSLRSSAIPLFGAS